MYATRDYIYIYYVRSDDDAAMGEIYTGWRGRKIMMMIKYMCVRRAMPSC